MSEGQRTEENPPFLYAKRTPFFEADGSATVGAAGSAAAARLPSFLALVRAATTARAAAYTFQKASRGADERL